MDLPWNKTKSMKWKKYKLWDVEIFMAAPKDATPWGKEIDGSWWVDFHPMTRVSAESPEAAREYARNYFKNHILQRSEITDEEFDKEVKIGRATIHKGD